MHIMPLVWQPHRTHVLVLFQLNGLMSQCCSCTQWVMAWGLRDTSGDWLFEIEKYILMGCVCFQQLLAHGLQHIVSPGNIQASRQQISGPAATAFDYGTPIQQPRACMLWMWSQNMLWCRCGAKNVVRTNADNRLKPRRSTWRGRKTNPGMVKKRGEVPITSGISRLCRPWFLPF